MVICLERGADLHMAQLMPLPLAVSCFSKIQIGFTFLVPAHLGSPGKGPLNGCVCFVTSTVTTSTIFVCVYNLIPEVGAYGLGLGTQYGDAAITGIRIVKNKQNLRVNEF